MILLIGCKDKHSLQTPEEGVNYRLWKGIICEKLSFSNSCYPPTFAIPKEESNDQLCTKCSREAEFKDE
jgi:hypothetical protein